MEAKTPREFLEQVLPNKFNPEKAKNLNAVVQINVTGPQGGNWTVAIKDQKMTTKEQVDANANITLKMKDTDFLALVTGKLNTIQAFMTGKLEFHGDMTKALKLADIGLFGDGT